MQGVWVGAEPLLLGIAVLCLYYITFSYFIEVDMEGSILCISKFLRECNYIKDFEF
jgi:hypothetical protein